jgi:hypothetical protein
MSAKDKDLKVNRDSLRPILEQLFEKNTASRLNIYGSENILTFGKKLYVVTSADSYSPTTSDPFYLFTEESHGANTFHIIDPVFAVYCFKGNNHTYSDHLISRLPNGSVSKTTNKYALEKIASYIFKIFCCSFGFDKNNGGSLNYFYNPEIVSLEKDGCMALRHAPNCSAKIDLAKESVIISPPRTSCVLRGKINSDRLIGSLRDNSTPKFDPQRDIAWEVVVYDDATEDIVIEYC